MTSDTVRVRFAPSPTGYLHVGGVRTALFNWLFARQQGGVFVLRIEDTDRTRYEPHALPDLLEGLRWLGLCWDEGPEVGGNYGPYFQSDRLHLYKHYADELLAQGHAYHCYCSPERLASLRQEQMAASQPTGYDHRCRCLTRAQISEFEAQGIQPVVRLAIPLEGTTEYKDLLRGHITVENRLLDDLILLKSDGFPTYPMAAVVDDHLMEITHILRGDEWLATVPKLKLLFNAFGWEMPTQVHLPTILDPSGRGKLSKRKKRHPDGHEMLTFVREFRQAGYVPEAMINFLALVGWSYDGQTEFFTRSELIQHFKLEGVTKSPSTFSYDKLEFFNASYLRDMGRNDLAGRLLQELLRAGLVADFDLAFKLVPLVRDRLKRLDDVLSLAEFAFEETITYDPELLIQKQMGKNGTIAALRAAEERLAALPSFDELSLETTLRGLVGELGLKVGQLFGTLRIAATGRKVSPPLFGTLEILGRDTVLYRIREAIELLTA